MNSTGVIFVIVSVTCLVVVYSVRREMDSEVETMQQTIQDLEQASDLLYMPDPDPNKIPVNRNLTRKAGYLNIRKYEPSLTADL